ncbi:MAG: 1,4-alpha-glucan branching protein GlgB [Rubrivivax sp.]
MLDDHEISRLAEARHGDPFAVLGAHADADGRIWVRTMQPGAQTVEALDAAGQAHVLAPRGQGVFEGRLPGPLPHRLRATWPGQAPQVFDDPYRFGPVLGELDAWLLAEGTHLRPYTCLGAHPRLHEGVAGTAFAVWAPNASRVSVVGDFNHWDGRRHPMRLRRECGVWELFVPGVGAGALYRFELLDGAGTRLPLKSDPCARAAELRPGSASVVAPALQAAPVATAARDATPHAPMAIYEVHLGSWRRRPDGGWLDWDQLADTLVPYAAEMGFTHLELLPVAEHPFDGSWGYQPTGLYAPTARFGAPDGLRRFVQRAHEAGLGVILDWVPAHFPGDDFGLARFDGTPLYEHADAREGWHPDWHTHIYNLGRREVCNFLIGNALYWIEQFGIDGLRVDAVASMLYRDYSRPAGQWVPNVHGGRENLEAIAFLRRLHQVLAEQCPRAVTLAEESTAFPGVSHPVASGGLGFGYKWNMGWMHDTLQHLRRDPVHRRWHQGELSFSLVYAFSERFVLPLSHDEVVHGKGSLLGKMPGDRWQRLANLRLAYAHLYGHPGKKLLFMGAEFAQQREWNHDAALDWGLLDDPAHAGVQRLVRDLNRLYTGHAALHERDHDGGGFEWIRHDDTERCLLAYVRHAARADAPPLLVLCNFTPTVHRGLRLGVPATGTWVERLNTDSAHYGGSDVGTPLGRASSEAAPWDGRAQSIVVDVPPLAAVFLELAR